MIYLLKRPNYNYKYAIYEDTYSYYSWWCKTEETAWERFMELDSLPNIPTIKDLLKDKNWKIIKTYKTEDHVELFI